MSKNPFEAQLRKEEALYSKQIAKVVNKALLNGRVVSRAQPQAKQEGKKAPKVTQAMYKTAAYKAVAKIGKNYPGMHIAADLEYSKAAGIWRAKSIINATYVMRKVGGAVHKVDCEETLWSISKKYYGSGVYWTVLADYNPAVKSSGKYLRAGMKLHVPQIEVIEGICVPSTVKSNGPVPKGAKKPAKNISYPNVVLTFSKKKTVEHVIPTPVATMKIALSIDGELSVTKPGVINLDFKVNKFEAEIKSAGKYFTSNFSINMKKKGSLTVSSKASGTDWTTSFTIKPNGTIALKIAPQNISFKHKGLKFEGSIAATLEITYILHYKLQPRSRWNKYGDWVSDYQNHLIFGFATLPFAAVSVSAVAASAAARGILSWGAARLAFAL